MKIIGGILAGVGGILSLLGLFKSTAVFENFMMIFLSIILMIAVFAVLHFWKRRKRWALPALMLPVAALLVLHGIQLSTELAWTFDCLKSVPPKAELLSTFWYDQLMDYLIFAYSFTGLLVGSLGGILLTFKRSKNNEQKN